jgi:pentatricopeptide repeat protein
VQNKGKKDSRLGQKRLAQDRWMTRQTTWSCGKCRSALAIFASRWMLALRLNLLPSNLRSLLFMRDEAFNPTFLRETTWARNRSRNFSKFAVSTTEGFTQRSPDASEGEPSLDSPMEVPYQSEASSGPLGRVSPSIARPPLSKLPQDSRFTPPRNELFPTSDGLTPGQIRKVNQTARSNPATAAELYSHLMDLLYTKPPLPLSRFLRVHASHPELRSVTSFNILISISIRLSSYSTVRHLLAQMRSCGIPPDNYTWKLIVRLLVKRGLIRSASRIAASKASEAEAERDKYDDISFGLLLESLGDPLPHRRHPSFSRGTDGLSIPDLPRLHTLRQDQIMRLVLSVIRRLLHMSPPDHVSALSLSKQFLQSLPANPSEEDLLTATKLINLHLESSLPPPSSSTTPVHRPIPSTKLHSAHLRTFDSLISLHPSLKPNSQTLFLLLGSLRKSKQRGSRAYALFRTFRTKWGTEVEDAKVRRLVAEMCLEDGRIELANAMVKRERMFRRRSELSPRPLFAANSEIWQRAGWEEVMYIRLKKKILKRSGRKKDVDLVEEEHSPMDP